MKSNVMTFYQGHFCPSYIPCLKVSLGKECEPSLFVKGQGLIRPKEKSLSGPQIFYLYLAFTLRFLKRCSVTLNQSCMSEMKAIGDFIEIQFWTIISLPMIKSC